MKSVLENVGVKSKGFSNYYRQSKACIDQTRLCLFFLVSFLFLPFCTHLSLCLHVRD